MPNSTGLARGRLRTTCPLPVLASYPPTQFSAENTSNRSFYAASVPQCAAAPAFITGQPRGRKRSNEGLKFSRQRPKFLGLSRLVSHCRSRRGLSPGSMITSRPDVLPFLLNVRTLTFVAHRIDQRALRVRGRASLLASACGYPSQNISLTIAHALSLICGLCLSDSSRTREADCSLAGAGCRRRLFTLGNSTIESSAPTRSHPLAQVRSQPMVERFLVVDRTLERTRTNIERSHCSHGSRPRRAERSAPSVAVQPCSGSPTESSFSARATASTSGSAVAIRSPWFAEAINTASAIEIGREAR